MINDFKNILWGKTTNHLSPVPDSDQLIHKEVITPLNILINDAKQDGFNLKVLSGFRSYQQQSAIWNNKALGKRVLLNDLGEEISFESLSKSELLFQILRWSALPGASRHHWGTDFDIYDANSLPSSDYQVQLTPQEVNPGGIFSPMHEWLDQKMQEDNFSFFRPYSKDLGGVAPERWHLSHKPLATDLLDLFTIDIFEELIDQTSLELTDEIKHFKNEIFKNFILNISK